MSDTDDVVAAVIQRVYGDATQTALDYQCAREIIAALRGIGWASLQEVAVLVEAAGGSVTVPIRWFVDLRERTVTRQVNLTEDTATFSVRRV